MNKELLYRVLHKPCTYLQNIHEVDDIVDDVNDEQVFLEGSLKQNS